MTNDERLLDALIGRMGAAKVVAIARRNEMLDRAFAAIDADQAEHDRICLAISGETDDQACARLAGS